MSCVACKASRLKTVDAFMEGYIAGYIATVKAMHPEDMGITEPVFCLAHDKMIT